MSVHLRKDGAWIVRYRDAGQERTKYFGKSEDAQAQARAFNASLGLREWIHRTPPQGTLTFGELARLYLEASPARMESSSINNLVWKLNARILPVLTAEPAASLTAAKLDQYVSLRLRQAYRRKVDGMARYPKTATIHREVTDILAILHWAVSRGYLAAFPATGYRKPARDDAVIAPPTSDEIKRLLQVAPEPLRRAICLAWYTGCRPGSELLRLRWDSVDWQARTLFIESAKKHGPRSRTVAIHPDLLELLKKWKSEGCSEWIIDRNGKPIGTLKRSWSTAKRKAGILRRLRIYDIRHSFAQQALRASGDVKGISAIIGHSRPDTTIRFYTMTNADQERQIVEKIASITEPSHIEPEKTDNKLKIRRIK